MIVFRRRLFWKVYLALLLSLITVAVLIGGLMWLIGEAPREIRVPGRLHLEDLAIPEQDGRAGAIAAALTFRAARRNVKKSKRPITLWQRRLAGSRKWSPLSVRPGCS
jgi:hypothetical protein